MEKRFSKRRPEETTNPGDPREPEHRDQQYLDPGNPPTGYKSSRRWKFICLPPSFTPYGELMRIGKPIGIMNIYFPYLFGTAYASIITPSTPPLRHILLVNCFLFLAGFLLRSLGCCWNDITDRDLDRQVFRTRLRPIARSAIRLENAYLFTFILTLLWIYALLQISRECVLYCVPLAAMVIFYPFAKRVTNFAQVVLGITLSWGVFIGSLAMGVDPIQLILSPKSRFPTGAGMITLCLIYILWTIMHDIIYAFQDIEDDKKAGIKSMAVLFQYQTGMLLWGLATSQVLLFVIVGQIMGASFAFYLFAVCGNMTLFLVMIKHIKLGDPSACLWWFQTGSLIFGMNTSAGLFGEYLKRILT